MMISRIPDQTGKLRTVAVPEGIEEVQSIRNCGVPIGVYGSERRDPRGQRGIE